MSISGPIFGSDHGERLLDELGEEYFCIPQFLLQDWTNFWIDPWGEAAG